MQHQYTSLITAITIICYALAYICFMLGLRKIKHLSKDLAPQLFVQPPPEPSLYEKKVTLLLHRYLFHLTTARKFDELLSRLENEFFISSKHISNIISENAPAIHAIRNANPSRDHLKKKYPHLVW